MNKDLTLKQLFDFLLGSILAGLLIAVIYYIYTYQPVIYVFFTAEDNWGEYATFLYLFVTALILLWALIKNPEFRKPGHFLFAMVAFLIAMEEISWGQRLFNIEVPEYFLSRNYQGEINLHNLDSVGLHYAKLSLIIFFGTIVFPALTLVLPALRNLCKRFGIPIISARHWPFFILPVYLLKYNSFFANEIAELLFSIAIFIMALDLVLKTRTGSKAYGYKAVTTRVSMFLLVWLFAAPLVYYFPDLYDLKYRLGVESKVYYPKEGKYRQADALFSYMNHHPEYIEKDTPYYHSLVLMKLGRNKEAKKILTKTLVPLQLKQQEKSADPEVHRNAGKILHLLGRSTEAEQAYLSALELDRNKLTGVLDQETKAKYGWSLAKTLFAMGKKQEATEQVEWAINATSLSYLKEEIMEWFEFEIVTYSHLMP